MLLNVMALAVFATLAGVVFVSARSQVKLVIFNMRQTEAESIAEAGLEDALRQLYLDANWRAGFTAKAFAGGSYTVSLSTPLDAAPTVTSTGYSKSVFMFGSAVKTISVLTTFTPSLCPYAIAGNGPFAIDGTVDRYDPAVTLTPSTTEFTSGADVRSNSTITTSQSCPPILIRGDASIMSGSFNSDCVEGGVYTTTETLSIPSPTCPSCSTVNDNLTGLSPQSAYNHAAKKLTVGVSDTVTLQPGRYYFRVVSIRGTLNVDTSSGAVTIYLEPGTFSTFSGCQINNLSKIPSRLQFADLVTSGHTLEFRCSTPLHAHFSGSFARTDLYQELYGHLCSDRINVDTTGKVHFDGTSTLHVSWTSGAVGSWQESYQRQ